MKDKIMRNKPAVDEAYMSSPEPEKNRSLKFIKRKKTPILVTIKIFKLLVYLVTLIYIVLFFRIEVAWSEVN